MENKPPNHHTIPCGPHTLISSNQHITALVVASASGKALHVRWGCGVNWRVGMKRPYHAILVDPSCVRSPWMKRGFHRLLAWTMGIALGPWVLSAELRFLLLPRTWLLSSIAAPCHCCHRSSSSCAPSSMLFCCSHRRPGMETRHHSRIVVVVGLY